MTAALLTVKERPVLFSGPMIRAILEGKKTQTRRVVKYAPFEPNDESLGIHIITHDINSPYGKTGDRLWCRETFAFVSPDENERPHEECNIEYRADTNDKRPGGWDAGPESPVALVWKPSIFMPRAASRITLEVTDTRVERLQSISEEDAIAEGIRSFTKDGTLYKHCWDDMGMPWRDMPYTAKEAYQILWESINGKKYPWSSNPWVWCISFRRV